MVTDNPISVSSGWVLERGGKRIELYLDAMPDQSYILVVLIGYDHCLVDQCYCYRNLNGLKHALWLTENIADQLVSQGFHHTHSHQIWQLRAMYEFNAHRNFTKQQQINTEFLPLGILQDD